MTASPIDQDKFRTTFLLLLILGISLLFVAMIRPFLVTLLLAAIFTGVVQPVYRWILRWTKGRKPLAAAITLVALFVLIVVPLIAFASIVAAQAVSIGENAFPWIEQQLQQQDSLDQWILRLPFGEQLVPYHDLILTKLGQLAQTLGSFAVGRLAAATGKTVKFLFLLFVMLYAMFYFLMHGRAALDRILYYMPLGPGEEDRMVERFTSVTRATIKGTLLIGVVQGTLAGGALWAAGIHGAMFWGTVMAVLSIIPGVGTALVWIPAVVYLFSAGRVVPAILVTLWCALVVGMVDNVMRPWLVGRDTKMPDLMILVSTLGGLAFFGAVGIILGPIVAALFLTVWEFYGASFKDVLPSTGRTSPRHSSSG